MGLPAVPEDRKPDHLDGGIVRLEGDLGEPPQWVIMGIRMGAGVAVLASSTLTRAEMRRRFEDVVKDSPLGKLHLRQERNAVAFLCDGFTFVHGATYQAAMQSLTEVWQPPEIEA